jgi:hypothetical protein
MKPIEEEVAKAKRHISRRFLGKFGIHGVGIHRTRKEAIVVYREKGPDAEEEKLFEQLEEVASPCNIEIVEIEAPTTMRPVPSKESIP